MLIKVCRWLGKKFTGIYTLLYGTSWDGRAPEQQDISSPERQGPGQPDIDNTRAYTCQFCHQSGKDRFKGGPCRACSGSGTVKRDFKNPIECRNCQGKGVEPYQTYQCKVCGGIGLTDRADETMQKPKIPITYAGSERSESPQEIHTQNQPPKSASSEPS